MTRSPRFRIAACAALASQLLLAGSPAAAQMDTGPGGGVDRSSPASGSAGAATAFSPNGGRYAISGGGEDLLTIDVQIWGQVHRPGQYSVPDRTDLIGLISYAGGPTESARLKRVLVIHPFSPVDRVQEVSVEEFIRSGDAGLIPSLTPGDVVVIPASKSHRITRWAGLVSVAALVANVALVATRD